MQGNEHLDELKGIADYDVEFLYEREKTYRGSWKAGGGRSAWFMLRRKMDRLLNMMARPVLPKSANWDFGELELRVLAREQPEVFERFCRMARPGSREMATLTYIMDAAISEDVFAKIEEMPGGDDGTVLAEIRDLRRYLLLVESEMIARGVVARPERPNPAVVPLLNPDGSHRGTVYVASDDVRNVKLETFYTCDWDTTVELGHVNVAGGTCRKCRGSLLGEHRPGQCENIAPGTPEDGGHHARQSAPLALVLPEEKPWLLPVCDMPATPVYVMYHPGWGHLEPTVDSSVFHDLCKEMSESSPTKRKLLEDIIGCYVRANDYAVNTFVLDVRRAPPARRDLWPRLRTELNSYEYRELLDWQRIIYNWNAGEQKYILDSRHESWTGGGE